MVYPPEDLDFILSLAEKYNLWIMNDEIWSDVVYNEKPFTSILSFGAQRNAKTLSVFGFSKSFGIAGLRAGALYAHEPEVFEKMVVNAEVRTTAGGISSLSQVAGIACLNDARYWVEAFLEHLTVNRDYAVERLNAMPGITCHTPQATYMVYPNITGTNMSSEVLVSRLRKEAGLAIIPGGEKFFGPASEGYVRICYATSLEILRQGLDRLEDWLKKNVNQF